MSIQVDRFEPIKIKKDLKLLLENEKGVIIKDHLTDKIIAFVTLEQTADKNIIVARKLIEAIENHIESNENQHQEL